MSYDTNIMAISYNEKLVSIPLEQGNVLRLKGTVEAGKIIGVSIPLEQGNVLRLL